MATETESPGFICLKRGENEDGGNRVKEVESGSDQPFEITRGQVEDTVNTQLETGKLTDESGTFLQALSVPMVNTPESCKAATVAYFEEGQGLNVQKEEAKDVIIDLQEASEKCENEVKNDETEATTVFEEGKPKSILKEETEDKTIASQEASDKCEDGEKDKSEQKQEESATKSVQSFSETGQQEDTEEIKPTVETEEKMEQQGLLHAITTDASQVESEEDEVKSGEVGQNEKFAAPSVKEVCEETGSEKVEYKDEASENSENGAKRKREQNPEENVSKIVLSYSEIEQAEDTEEIKTSVETEKKTKFQGLFHAETTDDCITTQTEPQVESEEHELKSDETIENDDGQEEKSDIQAVREICEETSTEKVECEEEVKHSDNSNIEVNEKTSEILGKDEDQEMKQEGNMLEKEQGEDVVPSSHDATFEASLQEKNHHSECNEPEVVKTNENIEEINTSVETTEETAQQKLTHAITTATKTEPEDGTSENEVKNDEVAIECDDSHKSPVVNEACEEIVSEKVDESKEDSKLSESSAMTQNEKETESKDEDQEKKQVGDITINTQEASKKCEHEAKDEKEQKSEESVNKIVQSYSEIEQEEDTEKIKPSVEVEEKTEQKGLLHDITDDIKSQAETAQHEVKSDRAIQSDDDQMEKSDNPPVEAINTEKASEKHEDEVKDKREESANKNVESFSKSGQENTEEIKPSVESDKKEQVKITEHERQEKEVTKSDDGQKEYSENLSIKEVCEESHSEKVDFKGIEVSEKDEDQEKEQELSVPLQNQGDENITSTQRATSIEDLQEKSYDGEGKGKEPEFVKTKECMEEDTEEMTSSVESNEKVEQQGLLHDMTTDVSISTQTESLEEATKKEEEAIESDGDQKEKLDNPSIKEVSEETDLKKTLSEERTKPFEQEEEAEEIKPSIETEKKMELNDDCITAQTESQLESAELEAKCKEAIESDVGQKEKSDIQAVREICEETSSQDTTFEAGLQDKNHHSEGNEPKVVKTEESIGQDIEEINTIIETSEEQKLTHAITTDICILTETEPKNGTPENEVKNDEMAIESDDSHMNKYESPMVKEACEETVSEKADEAKEDSKLSESSRMTQNEDEIESKDQDQEKKEVEEITLDPEEAKEKCEHEERDAKEQKSEESVSKTVQSCSEIEQEEDTEEIKSSVEVEEKTPQAGTTEHEDVDKVIESDDGPKEIIDSPSVKEVCEETGSERIVHIEEVKHSDSSNTEIKSGSPLVKEECEETVLEKAESEEGLKLSDSFDMALNENEIASKDQEKEEVYVLGKSQYGGDDVTSSEPATCEDIKETTVDQPVTSLAYCEEEQAVSSMPKEILKEEAENKSSDAQEVSEQYEDEAKDKTEEKPEECVSTIERSFSITENTEEIKPSVETDEKEQVKITGYEDGQEEEVTVSNDGRKEESENLSIKETQSEDVGFEGVKISDKDEDQEKEQELSLSEKFQGGGDDVTSSQNATTMAIQEEQGLNAMPKDILKEEPQEASEKSDHGAKEELEQNPEESGTKIVRSSSEIEQETEQIKTSVEIENYEQQGFLHDISTDGCITSQTESQVENIQHVVKSDETIQSDDGQKEISENPSVHEVCEETGLEKVECKEEVNHSGSSNTEIKSASPMVKEVCEETVLEKVESEDQGEDYVTCLQDATSIEDLQTKNYDDEGKEPEFVRTREFVEEDIEEMRSSAERKDVEQQELLHDVTTDVCISTQTESQEEATKNEEEAIKNDNSSVKKVCEETDLSESSSMMKNENEKKSKEEDQEKEQELCMSEKSLGGEDDVTSSQNASSEVIEETSFQHATTVTYLQEEKGLNETPKDIQKEEAEDTATEEVKPSVVQSDDGLKENLDVPSVKEVFEEIDSEKVEYKEDVKQSDSSNTEISSGSPICEETVSEKAESEERLKLSKSSNMALNENEIASKVEDQEKEEVYVLEKCQGGGHDITSSEPPTFKDEDQEKDQEVNMSAEDQGKDDVIATDVYSMAQTEPKEETVENEENIEAEDKSIDAQEASVKCDHGAKEELEQKHEESVTKIVESCSEIKQEEDTEEIKPSVEEDTEEITTESDKIIQSDDGQKENSEIPSVKEVREETGSKGQDLSSMPIEILKEEAEDKSSDAQKASEQYGNEAKDKIEQKPEECIDTTVRSFSDIENIEEIKPSVETDEKKEQVFEESQPEKVEFDGVELSNKEKEQELSMSENSHGGGDDITSSQNASSEVIEETTFQHATTVAYFQQEQGLNATPIDIQKEEAKAITIDPQEVSEKFDNGAREEKEQMPEESVNKTVESCSEIEHEENTEEVKPSIEATDDCITAQEKSHVKSGECEVKGDEVVQSDSIKENLDSPLVREVSEETDSEKVEYKEEVKDNIAILSKDEDQENAQEVSLPEKEQDEDQVTCSQDAVAASEEKLHGENYDGEGNEQKFVETREIIREDNEIIRTGVVTEKRIDQEGMPNVLTTDVCTSAQTESQEETNENEEKKKESIESDDSQMEKPLIPSVKEVRDETSSEKVEYEEMVKAIPTFKDKDQEKEHEVNMSAEDQGKDDVIATDVCSSAQTEPKEETVENEEKIDETEDKSIDDQEILEAVEETTTMKLENITEKDFQESECKTNKETEANRDVENQLDRTEDKSVMKDDIILTEKVSSEPGQPTTVSENTEDEVPKKDENLSYDIIEDTKDNASEEEKCFLDGRTRELEPVEEHSGGLDEVSKAESTDLNETTKVEPQDDTTLSSSFGTSIEDTPNLEKEKPESKIFPIEDIESVSEEQIPGVVLKSEDSNLKEECLIPATAISVDEEKGNVTKEISSDEMQMKSAQDQKEIADEISYPDTIPVKNPEVTEVRVDAQIEKEDLEAAEDISCESKASSTIQALETDMMEGPEKSVGISGDVKNDDEDEAPKEDSIPALENVATLEPQVNLPNTESTIVPSESEESSKEALESVCDVQTPEVVADSEDSKVKEWCIVSAQAENMDENNEELEIRSSENTEKHREVKPTSESVIEEDQVKETESQPEQSDITSVNIMKDQILESSLDCTSEKNVVDEKRDMEEDVTLAPENQIDNIENQNETIKNAILTDEVAMETEKEKGEDEVEGHVSEKDSCPTSLSNQKELPNEMEYSKPIPVGNTEVTVKAESQIEDDSIDEASKNKIIPVLEDAKALEHQVKIPDTPSNDQDIMNLNEGLPCSTQETIEEKSVLISQLTDREILEEASENRKKTPNLDFTEKELTKTFSEHQNSIKESYIEKEGQGNVGMENKEAKSGNEVVEDVIVNEVLLEVEKTKESKSVKDNINEEDSCLKNQIKSLNSSPDELLETKDSVEDEGLMAENLNLKGETSTTMKGSNEDVEKSREITASEFENSEFMVTEKKIMEEDANKEKETLDEPQADDHAKTSFDSIASSTEQGIEVRSDESRGHSDMHKLEEKAIECSEIQQQHLSTKEATLGSIDQDNQSDAKTTEGTSPEASIPIEDPEAPSVMNSVVGKAGYSKDPNDKTTEVYEAEKGVLKEDMNLESTCDRNETTEEGSGVKQVIPSPTEYSENKPLIAEPEDKASGTEPQCSSEVFKEEKKMSDEKEKSQAAEPAKILLSDMLYEQTKGNPEVAENLIKDRETALTKDQKLEKEEVGDKGAKTEEENEEEDEEDDQKLGSCSDAPVMVEASKDMEVKTPKKSHNILSGVGSKVKHSIAKVKKAITGKSSHPKPSSPKETDKVIA